MKTNFVKSILVLVAFALYLLPAFGQSPEKNELPGGNP